MIHRHERELRVELRIHHREVQFVNGLNWLPIRQRRAAERVHAEFQTGGANGFHVHDIFQILDVRQNKIFLVRGCGLERGGERHALHAGIISAQQFIRAILHPLGHVGVGRAAVGGIVFEPAVGRRIVRRRDDDAVGETGFATAIVNNDGARNHRRRRHAVIFLNDGFHAVGREHFERGALCGRGKPVRVLAHLQRAADVLAPAVIANGLRDGENMRLGERAVRRRAAMSAGAEADQLVRVAEIRPPLVIIAFEPRQIHEHFLGGRFAGQR